MTDGLKLAEALVGFEDSTILDPPTDFFSDRDVSDNSWYIC